MLKTYLGIAALLLSASTIHAQVTVSETYSIDARVADPANPNFFSPPAGEVQSTIIPPGLKPQCPKGCFLATRDGRLGAAVGTIAGRELDKPLAAPFQATINYSSPLTQGFDCGADVGDYVVGNDHDIVTLPNGDVLYIAAVCLKTPLNPKPYWFDDTFRGGFGPGARTGIMTWRSQDGGRTFHYLSLIDSAGTDGGVPGYPQYRDKDPKTGKPYDMGGSDGPQAMVDPATGKIYITAKIEGYFPLVPIKIGKPQLPPPTPIGLGKTWVNKTVLYSSSDSGATWKSFGLMDTSEWRFGSVPVGLDRTKEKLAFVAHNRVHTGSFTAPTAYSFTNALQIDGNYGWTGWGEVQRDANNKPVLDVNGRVIPLGNWVKLFKHIYANVWANTVTCRVPGNPNKILVVMPAKLIGKGYGHRVIYYDTTTGFYNEGEEIFPQSRLDDSATMHLTVADSRRGAILLYWSDMTGITRTGKIRGRIISGDEKESSDFDISESFDLKQADYYWYGDYHTASGYYKPQTTTIFASGGTSYFYPMWVQPDSTIRYAEVAYSSIRSRMPVLSEPLLKSRIPPKEWVERRLPATRRLRASSRIKPVKETRQDYDEFKPRVLKPVRRQ